MNNRFDDYEMVDSNGGLAKSAASTFMSKVFSYMFLALIITGVTAWVIGSSEELFSYLITIENGYATRSVLGWIVMLSPLAVVIYMGTRIEKSSVATLQIAFFLFSVLFGASISYIFVFYQMGHISMTFFISAATFGIMALVGYTTSTDLSKMGSILYMALGGLVIAVIANWFMQSSAMDYYISGAGVLIFTGLAAWDTQKLKTIALTVGAESETAKKAIIMGALTLYLDFINLFLFMLRFMGGRD